MTLEGAIEARNDRGIKLDGEWRNVSKFRPVAIPEVGAYVRAEVDEKGFLKSLEQLDAGAPACTPEGDARIARLTVLKAAANFAATRADIKSGDVLRIAESWLIWIDANGA